MVSTNAHIDFYESVVFPWIGLIDLMQRPVLGGVLCSSPYTAGSIVGTLLIEGTEAEAVLRLQTVLITTP